MRPYLISAKLMRPSNMKRFPTPALTRSISSSKVRGLSCDFYLWISSSFLKLSKPVTNRSDAWRLPTERVSEFVLTVTMGLNSRELRFDASCLLARTCRLVTLSSFSQHKATIQRNVCWNSVHVNWQTKWHSNTRELALKQNNMGSVHSHGEWTFSKMHAFEFLR
jgi:hypothetical protein